jgi:Glycosyltransferase family 87
MTARSRLAGLRPRAAGPGAAEPAADGQQTRPGRDPLTWALGWFAVLVIGAAILDMIFVSLAGPSAGVAHMPRPGGGPPWWLDLDLPAGHVLALLWAAAGAGTAGVLAGMGAVARGARPPVRLLLGACLLSVAALTVLPAAGSTDAISYAINGEMVVKGHSPYVETPAELARTGDPVARLAPPTWKNEVSIYGPLATAEEWAAAELGHQSAARITFWLKLWNAIAFGAVVLALDRTLRKNPARRARAHLLWSLNPLLLWGMVASGHIDGLATALGFGGLLLLRADARAPRTFAAGLLIGAATACKITFGLFGVAAVWATRKSPAALAGAVAGMLVVLVPGYLIAGKPAVKALTGRAQGATVDNFYQLIDPALRGSITETSTPAWLIAVSALLAIALAVLLWWRLPAPPGLEDLPAIQPALALSLAWLFAYPFQRPWYDVMAICLIALYPLSRLDPIVMVRLLGGTMVYILAKDQRLWPTWLFTAFQDNLFYWTPAIRLAAVIALVWLCLPGQLKARDTWPLRAR